MIITGFVGLLAKGVVLGPPKLPRLYPRPSFVRPATQPRLFLIVGVAPIRRRTWDAHHIAMAQPKYLGPKYLGPKYLCNKYLGPKYLGNKYHRMQADAELLFRAICQCDSVAREPGATPSRICFSQKTDGRLLRPASFETHNFQITRKSKPLARLKYSLKNCLAIRFSCFFLSSLVDYQVIIKLCWF
jgi:hypothetical protein